MSVVGFDIGTFKSSVGIAKQGGIEIVDNEFSDRITPTYVSFTNRQRFQGHAAKQQEITHYKNTIAGFKRLLGRKFHDPQVQNEQQFQSLRISKSQNDDRILFNVDYMDEVKSFTCEQIMAIFLTKLKTIAESHLTTKVTDCVISVPSFMTDTERRALLDAAQIAGLNPLKLMNETTAVALNYGLYNNNLPEVNDKPHLVVFADVGYSQTQVSVCAFNKGKLKVLASDFDSSLGGRDFDKVLMDYFQQDFKTKYNLDANTNVRAKLRLKAECEKIKKVMSSNSAVIPLNIECFMNDKDVSSQIKREKFEELSENLLLRFKNLLLNLLKEAKLTPQDINVVEIVGGSTRIPAIKSRIFEVFGKEPSTTLNADEACARGCTLQCAILSPTFKVREFKIEDCQLFPITLNWKGVETDDNELEVFQRWDKIPMSKLLTIYKKEAFEIEARYRFPNNIPFNDPRIGRFSIGNVVPNKNGENSEVKVKARITKNGIFEVSSPQLVEIVEVTEEPAMEVDATKSDTNQQAPTDATPQAPERQTSEQQAPEENGEEKPSEGDSQQGTPNQPEKKKKKTKLIDLPITVKVPHVSREELTFSIEQELSMIQQDRKEKERSEAKNAVEEYIYEIRDKLSNEFERFVLKDQKATFSNMLEETESWLYTEEADDQEKSVYVEKLRKLKDIGEPIRRRYKEHEERPIYFEEFGKSLQQISKAVDLYDSHDEKYVHLEKSEVDKVKKCLEEKRRWYDEKASAASRLELHEDPIVLCSQIKAEKESLEKLSWPIFNRPKPKVEKPKEAPPQANGSQETPKQEANDNQQQQKPAENMDVD